MGDDVTTPRKKLFLRTRFIINPRLQYYLIAYFLVFAVLGTFLVYQMAFGHMELLIEDALAAGGGANLKAEILDSYTKSFRLNYLGVLILMVVGSLLGGIFLTHRVAGPIYKLNLHLKKIQKDGVLKEVSFRKQDFFSETADEFNEMVRKLKS